MDQHYIVIGGTSGIGKAITQKLQDRGCHVTTISRREKGIDGSTHIAADILQDDISQSDLPDKIRGIAYCPGSINLKPFRSLTLDDFEEDMSINLFGAVRSISALQPKLDKEHGASIVMFSTVAVGQGMSFHASVAAAKGAVEGFTRALAAEWAPSVRVNCIAPSITDTPMAERLLSTDKRRQSSAERHALKRVGTPDDIASMATFLLTSESDWITGQVIGVDGGLSTLR